MDMTGERRIPAPRQRVWDALNDPAVLRSAIPGCKTLERTSDTDMRATAAVTIGPIAAQFTGKVQLLDLDPPNSCRIAGEGQGGAAGFANGGATVQLHDDGAFTLLQYEVKAQGGGQLAQLDAGLVDAAAKQMAEQFFDRFSDQVAGPAEVAADGMLAGGLAAITQPPGAQAPAVVNMLAMIPKEPYGYPRIFWLGSAVFLVIFVMIFGSYVF